MCMLFQKINGKNTKKNEKGALPKQKNSATQAIARVAELWFLQSVLVADATDGAAYVFVKGSKIKRSYAGASVSKDKPNGVAGIEFRGRP